MNEEEWRKSVDEHLLRELIEDLQDRVKEIDEILLGERGKGGLIAEYDKHDEKLTRLYAVIFQDPTGQKGLLHDVDLLMGRRSERGEARKLRWQFWTAIIVALISSVSLLLTNWDKLKILLPKDHPGPVEKQIERDRHPRGKKIVKIHVIAPPVSDNTKESLQNE